MPEPEETALPKPNRNRRALLAITLGIALLATLLIFLRMKSEQRQREALEAEVAQRKTLAQAATRKACKLAPDAPLHDPVSIKGECQKAALDALTTPGSVTFPGMLDEDGALVSPDGCVTKYRSWMIAPDTTTQDKKQNYLCTWDPRTGMAEVELF